jgi:hypothetical protein
MFPEVFVLVFDTFDFVRFLSFFFFTLLSATGSVIVGTSEEEEHKYNDDGHYDYDEIATFTIIFFGCLGCLRI